MILTITKMQTKTEKSKPKEKLTNAIGFTLQEDDDDYEDE